MPVKVERNEPSIMESKLSGIYKGGAGRKNAINRVLRGEEELEEERMRLAHVVTRFNCFHFVVQEELGYLADTLRAHVATPNDKIDTFTGL